MRVRVLERGQRQPYPQWVAVGPKLYSDEIPHDEAFGRLVADHASALAASPVSYAAVVSRYCLESSPSTVSDEDIAADLADASNVIWTYEKVRLRTLCLHVPC